MQKHKVEEGATRRHKIEPHLRGYGPCRAVYDSTRKTLVIAGDERIFEIPERYGDRLHNFLHSMLSNFEAQ